MSIFVIRAHLCWGEAGLVWFSELASDFIPLARSGSVYYEKFMKVPKALHNDVVSYN